MQRLQELIHFLKADPDSSFLKFALAMEFINLGKDKEACTLLEHIYTHEPDYLGVYYHLAGLYQRLQKFEEAQRIFEEGIQRAQHHNDQHTLSELKGALLNLQLSLDE